MLQHLFLDRCKKNNLLALSQDWNRTEKNYSDYGRFLRKGLWYNPTARKCGVYLNQIRLREERKDEIEDITPVNTF